MAKANPDRASGRQTGANRKKWWIPVIVVLISTGLAVLGADLALRVFGGRLMYYRPNERFLEKWPALPLVSRYKKNVHYEGEAFGDLAAMQGDARFRQKRRVVFETDAFGFRNSQAVLNSPVYDVIVLGDSFGAGLGTTQDRTWVPQLYERHHIRAYNLSIPGGSPWQEYIHFTAEVDRLPVRPGSVVLVTVFAGNDLDDYYFDPEVPFSELPWNNSLEALGVRLMSFTKRSPILRLMSRLRHGNRSAAKVLVRPLPDDRAMLFFAPYVDRRKRTAEAVRQHDNYAKLIGTIRDIRRGAVDHGLQTVVVFFPCKGTVYEWLLSESRSENKNRRPVGFSRALAASLKKDGVPFVDLTPALVEAAEKTWNDSGGLIYWRDDTHWNELGHGLVADMIYGAVFAPVAGEETNDFGTDPLH